MIFPNNFTTIFKLEKVNIHPCQRAQLNRSPRLRLTYKTNLISRRYVWE